MKDRFSNVAGGYASFRPHYPAELFRLLSEMCHSHEAAWDCATGNGQLAAGLSPYFKNVFATDISKQQLAAARQEKNIAYSLAPAEATSFADGLFDLITVAQAIHWFRFDDFYTEARRVSKPHGLLAIIGYGLCRVNERVDASVMRLYEEVLHDCWDPERIYIEQAYRTIPFPFRDLQVPPISLSVEWEVTQLLGFLGTWSAVQRFRERNHREPLDEIKEELLEAWGPHGRRRVNFPLAVRLARLHP